MAVTAVTTTMAGAINYTVVTDTSADWPSVAFSTYFYDKTDKLVHYKDSAGNIQEIFSGSGITVGTTAVTSGTDGRVFFQAGGVVQQSANLFWDNTNNTLGIGTSTPSSSFKLDVNGDARFNGGATSSFGTQILNVGIRILTNAGNSGGISLDSNLPVGNRLNFNSNFTIRSNSSITSGVDISLFTNSVQNSTNTVSLAGISGNVFSTSGGNNQTNGLLINPTINLNAGNVSTIFRGIHYNPTLTSTTGLTHRAIETTTGDVIFGSTSGNVAIGSTSPGARLDVKAQGALSTDIAFRVRNSADTRNFLTVNGAGDVFNNGAQGVSGNAFFGENTGRSTTGLYNCFFGLEAGRDNSIGTNNSFFGVEAGRVNSSASFNSFYGIQAGRSTTTGSYNSFFGGGAGYSNGGGFYNAFFGNAAGSGNTSGSYNSCFGFASGEHHSTGSENIFLGVESGRRISSGSNLTVANNSIFIGGLSRANANSESNQIVIGHSAIGLGSNTTVIGNSSTTTWKLFGAGIVQNITAPSSSLTDSFHVYSNDITAGNAAPHFRTENGAIVKVYQETTAVASATLVSNAGTAITDTDTFDGYTLKQIVKALRNQGLLA